MREHQTPDVDLVDKSNAPKQEAGISRHLGVLVNQNCRVVGGADDQLGTGSESDLGDSIVMTRQDPSGHTCPADIHGKPPSVCTHNHPLLQGVQAECSALLFIPSHTDLSHEVSVHGPELDEGCSQHSYCVVMEVGQGPDHTHRPALVFGCTGLQRSKFLPEHHHGWLRMLGGTSNHNPDRALHRNIERGNHLVLPPCSGIPKISATHIVHGTRRRQRVQGSHGDHG
mmetsp:Transcript_114277/g.262214  ORF Transcript_114277/g.262214 Transcript_114277/m.262214 type:complete len:227 (+) Transcript_114277:2012-2692(+)